MRVALVLLLTAHLYSRTGRVTLAEGLYREATKLMQLSPGGAGGRGGGGGGCGSRAGGGGWWGSRVPPAGSQAARLRWVCWPA